MLEHLNNYIRFYKDLQRYWKVCTMYSPLSTVYARKYIQAQLMRMGKWEIPLFLSCWVSCGEGIF